MSFPQYESYRDTGVEWLGAVPSHWTIQRLGIHFDERREKVSDADFSALSVTKSGVVPQLETAAKTDDGENRKKVLQGDFVINSRSDRKGSSGLSDLDGSVSLINTVLIPWRTMFGRFAHHLFRSAVFQEEYYRFGKGIVADLWSTNYSEMRNILLAVPPLPEQQLIAAFLDRETAKIDALVEAQRRLIELLKEKRQAVISHAVTKGLDSSTPMKDSGVEWLGQVPAHWELKRLSRVCHFQSGKAHEPFIDEDGDYIYVSARFVSTGGHSVRYCTENFCSTAVGDILMVMSDLPNGRALARAFLVEQKAPYAVNQRVCRIRPIVDDPSFLAYQLDRNIGLLRNDDGLNQTHLSNGDFMSVPLLIPPFGEQLAISTRLRRMTAETDRLTAAAETAISLLQERRAALISAAVTGKIDVRGLVAADVSEAA